MEATAQALNVIGHEASAMKVAQAIMRGGATVDVQKVMSDCGLNNIRSENTAETAVFQAMQIENDAAKRDGRTPYSYVELTSNPLHPN